MIDFVEHCGKTWPHPPHDWLPDWPHAIWLRCPGSPETTATPCDLAHIALSNAAATEHEPERR